MTINQEHQSYSIGKSKNVLGNGSFFNVKCHHSLG
jgi:hypothetical protein